MNYFNALVMGLVEGLSEFLPISSTGHLILTARLLGLEQSEFVKSFEVAIQLGAILSVVVLYWRSFLIRFEELKRIICAFIPTGIVGFFLYKIIKRYFFDDLRVVLWSLFIGGIALVIFEKRRGNAGQGVTGIGQISYRKAFLVGLCQALAVVPGVSRSAATIVGGTLLGIERKTIVEFSFLLAVPTMAAATGTDLLQNAHAFSKEELGVLAVGFTASFVVAILCIKWFLGFVKKYDFTVFGVYRMILAPVFWFFTR